MQIESEIPLSQNHAFLGRKVIYTSRSEEEINQDTIPQIINGAMSRHFENCREIDYLFKYFRGYQPILKREKVVRPEINNRIVINNAYSIVRNATGYFLGEPIQFTPKKQENSEDVSTLNSLMDSENKSLEDMKLGEHASICGTSFRLVEADDPLDEDEAPFEIPTLEPKHTFVVYSSKAGHEPLLGVTYSPILNDDGFVSGTSYIVYDKTYQYQYDTKSFPAANIKRSDLVGEPIPHFLDAVPIVEYPNNEWRIGDFEIVMTILNAINKLHSDRMNSVEQIVNSLLVFIGCHLKTAEENKAQGHGGIGDYESLKEQGAIELPNADGAKADVKYVSSSVDQNEAETLAQTLTDYAYAISGIPDRKERSNNGGDTGDAVYLRDGFQSLELVARVKERNFKKSERSTLRMVCKILEVFNGIRLKPMDVDVKFIRNRTNNMLNKSQAADNLETSGLFAPEDIISLIGVTDDPKGMAERGQKYKEENAKTMAEVTGGVQPGTANGPPNGETSDSNGDGANGKTPAA